MTEDAKGANCKAGDFSYNTGKLRCPVCDGTGVISLDVQFLPDVQIPCPECRGSRYSRDAEKIRYRTGDGRSFSLPQLMDMDVTRALGRLPGAEKCPAAASDSPGSGTGVPDSGRGNSQSVRRRGTEAEAGQRDGENPSRIPCLSLTSLLSVCIPWTCRLCWGFFRRLLKTVLRWW